jgi:hypothetical protein
MMRVLTSQFYRIRNRRRYREVFAHKVRNKPEVLADIKFPEHQKYPGRVLHVPSNLNLLEKCQKSGSWVINYLPLGRPYFWTSKQRKYFLGLPEITHSLASDPRLLKSVRLEKYLNCEVSPDATSKQSLNIYSSCVRHSVKNPDIDKAILMDISGSESFQHFIQDCLPLISLIQQFPEISNDAPLIIKRPAPEFLSFDTYLRKLNINNPIIFTDEYSSLQIKELYSLQFKPFNATYSIPPLVYHHMYEKFQSNSSTDIEGSRIAIVIDRRETIRNFNNLSLLHKRLNHWCKENSLILKIINIKELTLEEIKDAFSRAKFVFAIHGGGNYNMIWAPKDCTLIEFVPTKATDSLLHLVLSFGQTYLPYALPHDKGDSYFKVSDSDLESILQVLDLSARNLST